jgi:hypothetical protein
MSFSAIMSGVVIALGATASIMIVYGIRLALRPVPEPPQLDCKYMDEATMIAYACWPVEVK